MTKVYIHIGTYKTGTTSIQGFLLHNREKLLAKGLLYPLSGRALRFQLSFGHLSHHNLFWFFTKDTNKAYDSNAGDWQDVRKEIDSLKPEKAVISTEHFCRLDYDKVSQLKNYLLGYQIKIIVYLRRQDDYLHSFYCQDIKQARYRDDIKKYILDKMYLGDYYKMLEPWKQVFGKENMIVKLYEKDKLHNGLIKDFLESIDFSIKDNTVKDYHQQNISPSIKVIKVLRLSNEIGIGKLSIPEFKLRKLYYSQLLKPNNKLSNLISKLPNFLISNELLSTQERINLLEEFEESNQKVAQEYLGRQDGRLFEYIPEPSD